MIELLTTLIDKYDACLNYYPKYMRKYIGLCNMDLSLRKLGLLTSNESFILRDFLKERIPPKKYIGLIDSPMYSFPLGDHEARKNFLLKLRARLVREKEIADAEI